MLNACAWLWVDHLFALICRAVGVMIHYFLTAEIPVKKIDKEGNVFKKKDIFQGRVGSWL